MVDGIEGFMPEDGEHAGGKGADEEGAEEAGGVGDSDVVDAVFGEMSVGKGLVDDGKDGFKVGAGGDFGDDATVGGEDVDLRDDDITEEPAVVRNDRGGGFVTRRFDGEDIHVMIIA